MGGFLDLDRENKGRRGGLATVKFAPQVLEAGGRVRLTGRLTTRAALRFAELTFGPEAIARCVLERLVVDGVDHQQGVRLLIDHSDDRPIADQDRHRLRFPTVIVTACTPIVVELSSHHDRAQEVSALLVGDDAVSPFPVCGSRPEFIARIGEIERVACRAHLEAGLFERLEQWSWLRRSAPPELRNARCGALYWRADEYPPAK
jgi:hypothetical protein